MVSEPVGPNDQASEARPEVGSVIRVCPLLAIGMALKIDVGEIASALDSVEVAVRAVRDRLTIDGMLELCTDAAAARTGN